MGIEVLCALHMSYVYISTVYKPAFTPDPFVQVEADATFGVVTCKELAKGGEAFAAEKDPELHIISSITFICPEYIRTSIKPVKSLYIPK